MRSQTCTYVVAPCNIIVFLQETGERLHVSCLSCTAALLTKIGAPGGIPPSVVLLRRKERETRLNAGVNEEEFHRIGFDCLGLNIRRKDPGGGLLPFFRGMGTPARNPRKPNAFFGDSVFRFFACEKHT